VAVTDHEGGETVPLVRPLTSQPHNPISRHARAGSTQLISVANCSNTFTLSVTHPSILGNTKTAAVYFEEVCPWIEPLGAF